ncbi:hypothetical protein, partial [Klebsiella pneumoniae]|uniref:hypothetical protein n=1 Tax=Klebsiella pneumoniae TaxID=573 RepID=UPI0025A2DB19
MKFKLKATEGTQQIVVRFDDSYLPDVLTQVGSFLQGCGYSFGEQSLELVPWEDDKAGQDIVAAYDVL